MSNEIKTLEKLYEIFAENDRKVRESRIETDHKVQEIIQQMKESSAETDQKIRESGAETDRKIQEAIQQMKESSTETDRKIKESSAETDQKIQETIQQMKESSAETDRKIKKSSAETDRRIEESRVETDRKRQESDYRIEQNNTWINKRLDKLLQSTQEHGGYINNAGVRVEQYFIKAISNNNCQIGDVVFDEIQANTARNDNQDGVEIDGLLINGECVGILEVKSTLHLNDVEKVITKIPRFRKHFKEYRDKKLLIYVAGEVVHKDAVDRAYQLGFNILTPDGQKIKLDNSHTKTF